MKRLVYRPKIWAYVKAMDGGVPIDISPYIVKGSVERVVNDVSTATITIRNPDFKFTKDPTFHPMDPITIFMARNINYPVRVFTGFLDDTPYLQLFPGNVTLSASCTIKRLKHTYWDPALPFTQYFLARYGWQQDVSTGTMRNIDAENKSIQAKNVKGEITIGKVGLNDSGLSALISASMQYIGHWDPKDLLVEPLPPTLTDDIDKLWTAMKDERTDTQEAFKEFLKNAIGDPPQEVAGGSSGSPPYAGGLSSSDGAGLTQVKAGESYTSTRGTFKIDSNNAPNLVWWNKGSIAIAKWIAPQLVWAKSNGWDGNLVTGFRTYAHQKAIYDSGTRPAAQPGFSNHEGSALPRGAVDVANYEQLFITLKKYKGTNRLVWAQSVNFNDPPHFSQDGH